MPKRANNPNETIRKLKHLVDEGFLSIQKIGKNYRSVLEEIKASRSGAKLGKQLGDGLGSTITASIDDLYDDVFE